jgi:hypothetical protein
MNAVVVPGESEVMSVPLSKDDVFFGDLARRQIELSLNRVNDALNRLITLATALSGGALVGLKDDVCTGWGRVLAATLFFIALSLAVCGSVPLEDRIGQGPDAVRRSITEAASKKKRWVRLSTGFLISGLAMAVVGAFAHLIGSP